MFVEAAGGVLVCGGLACAGSAVLRRRHQVAAALLAAGLLSAAFDAFGVGSALHALGCGFAVAGVLAMVLGRLGRPLPMTWLDLVMGGCAVGALSVTTGAELPATLAATGIAAALGLTRWRVSPALACALVGL